MLPVVIAVLLCVIGVFVVALVVALALMAVALVVAQPSVGGIAGLVVMVLVAVTGIVACRRGWKE
jgi:hypothetical protein